MSSRRQPLHTCGVSMIKIAMKASGAAQDLSGPLGSMAKKIVEIVSFAIPFVHALLYLWLVLLSSVDDHVLTVEDIIEKTFPPSKHIFNKIDDLVRVVENLPGKFDRAVKSFPSIIHQVPFLNWVLVHVISLLEILITILAYWGSEDTREKEIMVDQNCDNREGESESALVVEAEHGSKLVIEADNKPTKSSESEGSKGEFPPVSEIQQAESDTACVDAKQDSIKSTYKDVFEKGKNDVGIDQNINDQEKFREEKGKIADGNESPKDDPIIELFESRWLMKRGGGGK